MAFITHYCARGCGRIVAAPGRVCPPMEKVVPAACWPRHTDERELRAEMVRDQEWTKKQPSVFEREIADEGKRDLEERKARNVGK